MIAFLGIVTLYFVIGWGLARRDLPRAWQRARDTWSITSSINDSVKAQTLVTFFFWWIALPIRAGSRALSHGITLHDPKALEAELEKRQRALELEQHDAKVRELEQQRYIKKLERELGIGDGD